MSSPAAKSKNISLCAEMVKLGTLLWTTVGSFSE